MANKQKYKSTPKDPMPYPDMDYKTLKRPGNEAKYRERMAWVNRQSYEVHKHKRAGKRQLNKQQPAFKSPEIEKPQPTPFMDDSDEFRKLLAITPLNEPFEQAKNTEKPGVRKPQMEERPGNPLDDDDDDFYEEEETDQHRAEEQHQHEYVEMDDAKAFLFVRLSNFMVAIMTKMLYWAIGYDTDMDAMKLSDKDVETMAEDAKWFIKDVGMTPQQMYGFNLFGTVAMNGFYASKKQDHPWWEKWTKKKGAPGGSGKGPFKVNLDDDTEFTEAEVMP
jgi:hypothetical protein